MSATRRAMMTSRGQKDVFDLAAAIIGQARFEWERPNREEYRSVCQGDELLGHERCMFYEECWGQPGGKRYRECLRKRSALKQELIGFFNSNWFAFLCGDVEPGLVRRWLGVPEL